MTGYVNMLIQISVVIILLFNSQYILWIDEKKIYPFLSLLRNDDEEEESGR